MAEPLPIEVLPRVRTFTDERLSRTDFDAVPALANEHLGATDDIGVAEGVLTRCAVTYEEAGPERRIKLGPCILYGCKPTNTPSDVGNAVRVRYDPANTKVQLQTYVDVAGFVGSQCALWWSATLIDLELKGRRQYLNGFPNGKGVAALTRRRPRITFAATVDFDTPPALSGTWFRLAGVSFENAEPVVVFCHAIDHGFHIHAIDYAQTEDGGGDSFASYWPGQLALRTFDTGSNAGRSYGLARIMTTSWQQILRAINADFTFDEQTGEITAGPSGLGLIDGVVQANAKVAALNAAVGGLGVLLGTINVNWNGSSYSVPGGGDISPDFSVAVATVSYGAAHAAKVTLSSLSTALKLMAIVPQQYETTAFTDSGTVVPKHIAVAVNKTLPFVADGTSVLIEVASVYKASSGADTHTAVDGSFSLLVFGSR